MKKIITLCLLAFTGTTQLNAQATGCFKAISAGSFHTLAIKTDGSLWAWGSNSIGQLGVGSNGNYLLSPIQIGTATNWASVSAGNTHSIAIKTDGSLWAWGDNGWGQLGDGSNTTRFSPVQIGTATNWASICAGGNNQHSIATKTNGSLWAWGRNDYGQVGDGSNTNKNSPVQIGLATNWASISAGAYHSIATQTNGSLWGWGSNGVGQLGDGSSGYMNNIYSPVQIGLATWASISASGDNTLATQTNGSLWAWGDNYFAQLGDGTTIDKHSPVQIGLATNWASIRTGGNHTLATQTNGSLWAWGDNPYGQVGDGSNTNKYTPVQIGTATNWASISAGGYHTIAIKTDGSLWAWGYNSVGQLGVGYYSSSINSPTSIACPSACTLTTGTFTISACNSYTWAAKGNKVYTASNNTDTIHLKNAGGCDSLVTLNLTINIATHNVTTQTVTNTYTWNGQNYTASGTYTYSYNNANGCASVDTLKLTVNAQTTGCSFKAISAGSKHTIAIKTDGSLWAWGDNSGGQLGDGTTTQRLSPVQIGTATNWASIGEGGAHSIALKTDGTLWAWGANTYGQLGYGTNANSNSPVQIGTATNWVSISAGENHNMAIKTDGTLWAWGSNVFGQLGDGTTANSNSPVQIGTATNWASIDAGNYHTLAIKTDGSLWAWGRGNEGQLGDGSYISKNSPVQIGNATNWASISLGTYYSIAIQTNGSLWAWGDNQYGQLGNSSSLGGYYSSPLQIGNATNWASISAGEFHSIGIKTNGSLWAWGYNYYGQLGDGSDHNIKTSPVQIGTSTWSSIGAGSYHTIAIKTNGSLWAWGWNNQGRLGDGTTFDENSPVQIGCASCTPTTGTFTISACNSYTWVAKGNKVYTASNNTDTVHLTNAAGCDSVVTLNLTIKTPSSSTSNVSICPSELPYSWNDLTFTAAGTKTAHLNNVGGCDSAATLTLTIGTIAVTPSVSITASNFIVYSNSNTTFTASAINGGTAPSFEWYKNGTSIGTGNPFLITGTSLAANDAILCVLTANNSCQTSATANSNKIKVVASPVGATINYKTGVVCNDVSMCKIGETIVLANYTGPYGIWASSDSSVASVVTIPTSCGRIATVTANALGTTTISYTVKLPNGIYTTINSTVVIAPIAEPAAIRGAIAVCVGNTIALSTTATGGVWSSIAGRATINASGMVTGTSAGTANIKYTVTNTAGCSASTSKAITVNASPATPSIGYKAPFSNPQAGAPTGGFCVGKVFGVLGTPTSGAWSSTGCISVTNLGIATINTTGAGSLTYTFTNTNGCVNSRTMTGTGFVCAARGIVANNEKLETKNEFSIFPNPAKSVVYLKVETLVGQGQIIVTDLYGKTVKSQPLSMGNNTVNIANLSKGFYLISTITSQGKTTKKLIVE